MSTPSARESTLLLFWLQLIPISHFQSFVLTGVKFSATSNPLFSMEPEFRNACWKPVEPATGAGTIWSIDLD
jgi:hypothetical protein